MEVCPVGNRCRKCAERFTSHLTKVSPQILLKTLLAAGLVGFLYGSVHLFLFGGFFMWFLVYGGGFLVGRALHKVANHKLGGKMIATVVSGLLVGALASPARDAMLGQSPGLGFDEADFASMQKSEIDTVAAAEETARMRFPDFEKAFKNQQGDDFKGRTSIKDGDLVEHLWFKVESIENGKLTGRLANKPVELVNIRKGAPVSITVNQLEDWHYVDQDDVEVGNFTNRAIAGAARSAGNGLGMFAAGSFWLTFAIFIAGVLSPILQVRMKN
jgi:uncharacterized protein YegJ (DUF2314 family)